MIDAVAQLRGELDEARRLLDARTRASEVNQQRLAEARSEARGLAQANES